MMFSAKNEHLGSGQLIYIYLKIYMILMKIYMIFIYDYNACTVSRVTHDGHLP